MSDPTEYRIAVQKKDTADGVLFEGTVLEFPDVAVYAESASEAYEQAVDVINGLKSLFARQDRSFPEPVRVESIYSGKFIVRVPKSLHRSLAETASQEGVSLNSYVVSVLGGHLNFRAENSSALALASPKASAIAVGSDTSVHTVKPKMQLIAVGPTRNGTNG